MIDANTMEGMELSSSHATLEADAVWENLGIILSPNYELNGEKMCSPKLKKTRNSPKLETKDMLDYFDEPFSPTDGEKICSSKLKKPEKSPKLETKDVLDYFDEPFSPTNGEKNCGSKLKKSVNSPKQLISDEKSEEDNEWKWPSFSGMEPVVIQNGIASVTRTEPEETFDYSPPPHSPADEMSGENICLPSSTNLEVDDKKNRRSRPPSQ